MMATLRPLVAAAVVGAAGTRLARGLPPGWRSPFDRTNYAGDEVTLLEGPVWALASLTGSVGDVVATGVILAPASVGLVDDLVGDSGTKGLGGHLGALRRGRVTTGSAKIAVVVGTALVASAVDRRRRGEGGVLGLVVDAGVVAGAANLVNLLDLRPGRALKVSGLLMLPLVLVAEPDDRPAVAAALGATLGALPDDLAGRSMLGDSGSNAAGAALGLAATRTLPPAGRVAALATLVALTLASERVSFSSVIESTGPLRALDEWGRPPRPQGVA